MTRIGKRAQLLPLIAWFAALVVLSAGLLVMKRERWPGLHYDSSVFSTVAVNRAAGYGNVFDVYSPALIAVPSRQFVGHGQLCPGVLSTLFRTDNYDRFFDAIYSINILTACGFALASMFFATSVMKLGAWKSCWFSLAGALATTAVLLQIQGRPEHIIPLLVILGEVVAMKCRTIGAKAVIRGVELGAVASASPATGVVLASALLIVLLMESGTKSILRNAATLIIVSALSWAALTKLFLQGGSLWNLIWNAAQGDIRRRAFSEIVPVWLFSLDTPLIGLCFGLLVILSLWRYWNLRVSLPTWKRIALVVLMVNLAYWVFQCGIRNPPTNYRLLCLFPAVALALLWLAKTNDFGFRGLSGEKVSRFAVLAVIGALSLVSLGTLRAGILLRLHERQGGSFQEAREQFSVLKAGLQEDERIGIDPWNTTTLVVLDGPPWRTLTTPAKAKPADLEQKLRVRCKYFLLTQDGREAAPPMLNGFELERSFFKPHPGRLMQMLLGGRASGYQFAVYRRMTDSD